MDSIQIANTILSQLGGNKFIVMTGAKQFLALGNGLQFGIGTGASQGINKVRIILNGSDLYDVEFWRITRAQSTQIKTLSDMYAEDLQRVFTDVTGFDCHL